MNCMKKCWIILWLSAMTLNVTAQNEPYKNSGINRLLSVHGIY
jgi:hypothetical protein